MADWVRALIGEGGYLAVAALMLLETIFPPVPSEIIMSFAGLEAARGTLSLPGVILAGASGAMLGNIAWYALARWLGLARFRPLIARFGRWLALDWKEVERADRFFDRFDRWFVFVGRMVPTIRSLVSIPAGLFGMRWGPFLLWSSLGTLGWTGALAGAGYLLGSRHATVDRYLGPVANGIIIVLVAWYLVRVVTWKPRA